MKGALQAKFNRTSLLRLLPALLVAWLPFQMFDRAVLRSLYSVRGPLKVQEDTRVITAQTQAELRILEDIASENGSASCWIVGIHKAHGSYCRYVDISDLFTEGALRDAVNSGRDPLFYATLRDLHPLEADRVVAKPSVLIAAAKTLIILDQSYQPKIPVLTPIGAMDQGEWAVNSVLNSAENRQLRSSPEWIKAALPLSLTFIMAIILYSYPVMLTLIFALILGALAFVMSFLAFDSWGLTLPLAASWTSMLTVILLGMGDRLDRRERREWAVEHEAENMKSLDEMRNNFLSLVSHDLKTPIAKILSLLDRFSRGEFGQVTAEQKESLQRITSTSGYLQRTISTLLLLGRIESKDFRIHRAPTDITQLLNNAVLQHKPSALERNIRLEEELEPLFLVDLDPELILQVVNNLIENALKYTPSNTRVVLRCGESENCVELSPPQPGVWFEVQDEGLGIPKEDRARVLLKFERGSSEHTAANQSVKGTGLGLYLAKFFVKKHGGCLTLISKTRSESAVPEDPGHAYFSPSQSGTVIRITLPLTPPIVET